jgi:hypothetical protein
MLSSTLIMARTTARAKGEVGMIIMINYTAVYCEKSIWAITGVQMVGFLWGLCSSRVSVALVEIPGQNCAFDLATSSRIKSGRFLLVPKTDVGFANTVCRIILMQCVELPASFSQ